MLQVRHVIICFYFHDGHLDVALMLGENFGNLRVISVLAYAFRASSALVLVCR